MLLDLLKMFVSYMCVYYTQAMPGRFASTR
jgi:hypothetical protein